MLLAIQGFDKLLYLWCNRFQQHHKLMRFFRMVSFTGDGYCYVLIAMLTLLIKLEAGLPFVITGLLAFLFEIPLFITCKKLIKRDRPFVHIKGSCFAITPADKFSLPSGHTAAAFLMASLIGIYYPVFFLPAFLWATMIGASRVMLGVHYPTDILAGAFLGSFCTLLSLLILQIR